MAATLSDTAIRHLADLGIGDVPIETLAGQSRDAIRSAGVPADLAADKRLLLAAARREPVTGARS